MARPSPQTISVAIDPACVKTHTIVKCRKYNSPTRYRTSCAQHDSTPLRDVSTCAAGAGVFTQPRPEPDIGRIEIPQRHAFIGARVPILRVVLSGPAGAHYR